jgi:N6-adenosine-specific RNA methylase IME4/DNA-binding XRE family transcriptional regulator
MTDATPFQLLPALSSDEFDSLKADIAANGQRDPLVLRAGTGEIVDGHHRSRVCAEIGVDPLVVEIEFASDAEAQAYALRVNTNRRQLSSVQWSAVRDEQKRVYWDLRSIPGWTQAKASALVGVPPGTAAWWEREAKEPDELATILESKNGCQADPDEQPDEAPAPVVPIKPPVDNRVKLSKAEKQHIYELVEFHGYTHQQAADEYKVTRQAISKIVDRERDRAMQEAAHEAMKAAASPDTTIRYSTLVIDPPWPVQKIERDVRPNQSSHLDYPTMPIWCVNPVAHAPDPYIDGPSACTDIEPIDDEPQEPCESIQCVVANVLSQAAADDGHLYLWTTHKFLPEALQLAEAWGYRYQCLMTWRKNVGMVPFSWMYDTEHVLFCRRGSLDLERKGLRLSFDASITKHSAKPDVFYQRVIEASPVPRLELFSRTPREGFDAWGNEAHDDVA